MTLVPLGQGIAASVIVLFIASSWFALGSVFLGRANDEDEVAAPGAILIGSAIVSFELAVFAAVGAVMLGVIAVGLECGVMLIVRREQVMSYWRVVASPYRTIFRRPIPAVIAAIVGMTVWVSAISPPRSADAMRYHLAHIRQIVQDGRWSPIADYHYALPFGWSLSYLPFEMLRLPQGAQLLGVAVLIVFVSSLVTVFRKYGIDRAAIVASMLLILHPASLRIFVEASADAYAVLVMLAIALLVLRITHAASRDAALLGFAVCVGLQSRYQLGAAVVAAGIAVAIAMKDHPARHGAFFAVAGGALAALVLASPFYIMNEWNFHNPVWPLFINPESAGATYADTVAYTYSKSLGGFHNLASYRWGILNLVTTRFLLPIGLLIPAFTVIGAFRRRSVVQSVGLFGVIFLLEWAAMQPLLYPRFILLLLPVAILCAAFLAAEIIDARPRLASYVMALAIVVAIGLAGSLVYVNRDSYRYAVTGDAAEYHRYTWFHRFYDWVNHNTPRDARFLVIVSSAQTYYLDRPYRRADPWLTGVVDWTKVNNGEKLDSLLARGGYRYVIYQNGDWMLYPGGAGTQLAIGDAYRKGLLRKVVVFDDTLYTSRFRRSFRTARVNLLERVSAASSGQR